MLKHIKYTHIPDIENRSFVLDHVSIYWHEQITLHQQKSWELSFIITGSGTRIIGDRIEPFGRGEVILIPPEISHCWNFDQLDADKNGKIENITITFTNEFLAKCADTFPELTSYIFKIQQNQSAVSFAGKSLTDIQDLIRQMSSQNDVERLSSFVKLIALMASNDEEKLSVGKAVREDEKSRRMQKILLYIMNNIQNTIRLEDVAGLVGLDKSSFCIFFKKMSGKTFFTYLTDYRLEASCQMLVKTSMTVAEACYACGFKDVPYYNRTFKKAKGVTPTVYRKKTKSGK